MLSRFCLKFVFLLFFLAFTGFSKVFPSFFACQRALSGFSTVV